MKVALLLTYTCAVLGTNPALSASIAAPLQMISLEDLTEEDRRQLAYLNKQNIRPKRSGSSDVVAHIATNLGKGFKNKIAMIAKGSISASGHFSRGSSGHKYAQGYDYSYHHPHHHDIHHDIPTSYDHKSFDFWSLKKSILNTLLQAVKAIKGGVIAIKGQLIKGSGHLISAKGKIISAKGEAITNLGKHIASSAILVPYHGHGYSSSGHDETYAQGHYDHSSSGFSSSGPAELHHHHHPDHFDHAASHDHLTHDKPVEAHAGILILKKIPKGEHNLHAEETKIPDFKAIKPSSDPGWGAIIAKFLSASSSLKPGVPAPFGHESHSSSIHNPTVEYTDTHSHHSDHNDDHHSDHHEVHHGHYDHQHYDHQSHHDHHGHHVHPSQDTPHHAIPPETDTHEEDVHGPSGPSGSSSGPAYLPPTQPAQDFQPPSGVGTQGTSSSLYPPFPTGFAEPPTNNDNSYPPPVVHMPPSTNYGTPFESAPPFLEYGELTSGSSKLPSTAPRNNKQSLPKRPLKPKFQVKAAPKPNQLMSLLQQGYLNNAYEQPKLFYGLPNDSNISENFPPFSQNVKPTAGAIDATYNLGASKYGSDGPHNLDIVKSVTYQLGPNGPKKL